MSFDLKALEAIIAQKASASAEKSYTAQLLANGGERAAKKLGEEAVETVIAAIQGDRDELKAESADLLYHLLVVLKAHNISLEEVESVLAERTGQSGLEEKASRAE